MINDIVTDGHTAFVSTENNGLLVIEGQGTKKKNKNSRERSRISPATWRNPVDQHSQRQYTPLRPAPQNPAFHGSGVRTERQQHL